MNHRKDQIKGMIKRVILIGLSGGFLFNCLGFFLYTFNFIEISPTSFFVRIWNKSTWAYFWIGDVVALFIGSVTSMFIALLYYLLLKKVHYYWFGVFFGSILWAIIVFGIQPLFSHLPKMTNLTDNTSFTILLLFILYGTFISYSISFDYYETTQTEEIKHK